MDTLMPLRPSDTQIHSRFSIFPHNPPILAGLKRLKSWGGQQNCYMMQDTSHSMMCGCECSNPLCHRSGDYIQKVVLLTNEECDTQNSKCGGKRRWFTPDNPAPLWNVQNISVAAFFDLNENVRQTLFVLPCYLKFEVLYVVLWLNDLLFREFWTF